MLPFLVVVLSCWLLRDYFIPRIQIILGILVAPFVFRIKEKNTFSYRYIYLAAIFSLAYYFLHIHVLLFLALGCLLFFTIETNIGKIGLLPFLFLVIVSPAMHYAVNVFTFSIRLKLSEYAAVILNTIGIPVTNHGNYFVQADGSTFSVDTACIGLNMFSTGLCFVVLLIGFAEQRTKKTLRVISLAAVFTLTCLLLVLTNLLRIVGIVFFKSMPGTLGHDVIGILSLIVYTIVPVYFLINYLIKRWGKIQNETDREQKNTFKKNVFATISVCVMIAVANYFVIMNELKTVKDEKLSQLNLPGYTKTLKEDGVIEYRNGNVLIYIKPANKPYESDHPPNMCWQGSGFQLTEITQTDCEGYKIFSATLKKESATQYTAWWYDNGQSKTISQWDWRFAKGEPYRTINITTDSKLELEKLCSTYLKKKLF